MKCPLCQNDDADLLEAMSDGVRWFCFVCGRIFEVIQDTDWTHGYKDNPTNKLKPVKLRDKE